jgi:D-beta-D-heptose 7-phosphate kinase / D-beta-D-heptose 1-phosphate adenosyltransferase
MSADLIELVQKLGQPHILVLGDLMLDRYVWGDAERISQEAPVILLHADKREERLGGASSVAMMLRALGARVTLAGVIGGDADGGRIRQLLADLDIDADAVICDAGRPTTVKERYVGRAQHRHPQQMIRVDYETREPLADAVETELCQALMRHARKADLILVSDYDKGVCTQAVMAAVFAAAKQRGVRTVVDPIRGGDYSKYRGCTAMTPNRLEAGLATSIEVRTNDEALQAASLLQGGLSMEAAIVTLDKDGMALAHRDGRRAVFATRPRHVYDITGAGDMVMSVLGMALAAGADYDIAIRLANVAGGLEVEKVGVATVSRDEILTELLRAGPMESSKILTLENLCRELEIRRRMGQRVAFTNGCFDVLHAGHIQLLQEARTQADLLVVAVNSDASVRSLKGPTRPLHPVQARALVLAAVQVVDYVTVFEETTPLTLIQALRPDVLVKGADYRKEEVVGAAFVESYGGRVHLAALREGYSTSGIIKKFQAA